MGAGLCACSTPGGQYALQTPDLEPIRYSRGMSDLTTARGFVQSPKPGRFSICYGNTCRTIATVDLSGAAWQEVRALFTPAAQSAEEERGRIAAAIALIESAVGAVTGTWRDRERNFAGRGEEGQLDCVDEANNSTVYLDLLRSDGLLQWHRPGPRVSRGISRLLAPHFTATMVDSGTGARYAVDSWFGANGEPPQVVALAEWQRGWEPESAAGRVSGSIVEVLQRE